MIHANLVDKRALSHSLTAGDLVVDVAPQAGGSIARFDFRGTPVFRAGSGDDPRELGCFPLVPFSNRIRNGRLPTPRGDLPLAPLPGMGPHPIHGLGWQCPWAVDAADATTLAMRHVHAADPYWPFDYLARQTVRVDAYALEIALALTNCALNVMPAGIGLHPYFPATPLATLITTVADMWQAGPDVLPTHRDAVPGTLRFGDGQVLAATRLDHCFGGWSGRATLAWPERTLALDMEASEVLRTLIIYTPPGRDFFCVEPASHLINGFQLAAARVSDTGVCLLAPGETLAATVRFVPRAL
jgi:aldose 1-epimerase